MAARAIWKGTIRFGGAEVPVKLYSAVEDRSIHFRLLDAKRKEPITQRMVDPDTGKPIASEEVGRAFEAEKGRFVRLDDEELEELEPEASRDVEIAHFVPVGEITDQWYDRPYYLGPDGDEEAYFGLVEALRSQAREGIASWTMRKKEYVGALRVAGDYLMLVTLRHTGEVVPVSALKPPAGRDLDAREVKMAKQLIAALEDEEFDITSFKDEYRERVLELVEAKASGAVVTFPKAPERPKERSLAEMLEKSLKTTGKRKRAS